MSNALPRLRLLEVYPVQSNGTKVFCLRDPEGYQDEPLFLSPEACLVAVMLDGNYSKAEIQKTFAQRFEGQKISDAEIQQVIQTLDECFFLETKTFTQHKARMDAAFKAARVRDPFLAGRGYPRERQKLRSFLDKYYRDPKGPGAEPGNPNGHSLAGLIVPHIDFYRGGWCYAHAYKALAESKKPKKILLLGVAHAGSPTPFVFCNKSYGTPIGHMPLDLDGAEYVRSRLGDDLFEHEGLHRTEHSIEFQAIWLSHLYPEGERPEILPVLTSSFGSEGPGSSPSSDEEIEKVLSVLAELYSGPDCLVLAGVDLAHVGPRFGDSDPLDEALAQRTRSQDEISNAAITQGNAQGFWNSVTQDGNKRKVCGLSAIYSALRILGKRKGHLLSYGQALDPAGGIVSFTAASFAR